MLFQSTADERAAIQFDDLASSLEAGLNLASLGASGAAGDRAVHEAIAGRGIVLTAAEDAVIAAATRSGRIAEALRGRAEQRRQRARFRRDLWSGLRYPLFLVGAAVLISLTIGSTMSSGWFPTVIVLFIGLMIAAAWALLRGLRNGGPRWRRIPWFGTLAADLGELPYLEALHALYASGVAIIDAHATATTTVHIADVRIRLRSAERAMRDGRSLTEALEAAAALNAETRQLVAAGETAGQLEDALQRALSRRRDVSTRNLQTTIRWIAGGFYGFALLAAVYFILSSLLHLRSVLGR
ncbi:MAG: type II secretion system F family protein [Planctomycetes bacterium]|nr:type II secretion system F family protein [Planctomycetota bacterium]